VDLTAQPFLCAGEEEGAWQERFGLSDWGFFDASNGIHLARKSPLRAAIK